LIVWRVSNVLNTLRQTCAHARRITATAALPAAQRGQSVVEMAVLMVLLIPVILGALDIGRAYFDYDLLVHAVNEGARWGSFDNNTANIISTVRTSSDTLSLQTTDVTVTCYSGVTTTTKACASVVSGDAIKVQGQFVFQPITPWAARMMTGGQLTLSATAQRTYQ